MTLSKVVAVLENRKPTIAISLVHTSYLKMKFKIKEAIKKKIKGEASTSTQAKHPSDDDQLPKLPHYQPQKEIPKSKKATTHDTTDFSKIEYRGGDSWVCYGCSLVEQTLFTKQNLSSRYTRVKFHNNFKELLECSKQKGNRGCRSCRVFHRALILRQASKVEEEELLITVETQPVTASLSRSNDLMIEISLGRADEYRRCAYVACVKSSDGMELQRLECNPNENTHSSVKKWLSICENHHKCWNFAWSQENPSRLLRLISETTFQLEDCRNAPFRRYVALSYCWGGSIASPEENNVIEAAKTIGQWG